MEALCAQYRRERTNLACMSCFSTRSANVSLSQIRCILNAWYIDTFAGGHLGRDKTLEKICSLSFLRSCHYHARAMENFQEVLDFLSEQRYPEGLTKDQKRNFR